MGKIKKVICQSWRRALATVMAMAMVLTALPQSALMAQAEEPDTEQGVTAELNTVAEKTLGDIDGTYDGTDPMDVSFDVEFLGATDEVTIEADDQASPGEDYVFKISLKEEYQQQRLISSLSADTNMFKPYYSLLIQEMEGDSDTYYISKEEIAYMAKLYKDLDNVVIIINIGTASRQEQQYVSVSTAGIHGFEYCIQPDEGAAEEWTEAKYSFYGDSGKNVYFRFEVDEGYELAYVKYYYKDNVLQAQKEMMLEPSENGTYICTISQFGSSRIEICAAKRAQVCFVVEHATVREYDRESGQSKDIIPDNVASVLLGQDFYYTIEPEAGYKVSDVAYKSGNSRWDFDLHYGVICPNWNSKDNTVVYVTVEPLEKHTVSFEASDLSGLSVRLAGEETAFEGSALEVTNAQRFTFTLQAKEAGKAYYVTYKMDGDQAESVYSYEEIYYNDVLGQELICQEFDWAGFVEKDMTIKIAEVDLADVTVQRVGDIEYIDMWAIDDVEFLWSEMGDGETENSQRFKIPAGYGIVLRPSNDSMDYECQELVTTVTAKDKAGNELQVSKRYSDEGDEYVDYVTITGDMTITATGELKTREITISYPSDQGEVKVFDRDGNEINLTDRGTVALSALGSRYISFKIKAYDDTTRPRISCITEDDSWGLTLTKDCLDDEGWYCSNLMPDYEEGIYIDGDSIGIEFRKYHKLTIKNPDLPAGKLQLYRLYYDEYDDYYYIDEGYYDGEGLLPKDKEVKEYTIERASGGKYMLAFEYSPIYKVDFSCTAGGVTYTPEILEARLGDSLWISYILFVFTEDMTLNIQAREKQWYEVTVDQTENVQKNASIEGQVFVKFGGNEIVDACQSTEDGKYRVLEDSKVYISLDTVNSEHRGTLTITTSDGKTEKLPYKSNSFEVQVTSDMTISLDAEAAENHTLHIDDASHLEYCGACICTNGEKSKIEDVEGSYTICDAEEYRIYFEENPGKKVSKVEVQYSSQTSKVEKKICYDNGEDLYYCDLGYGTEDMTVYFTYEDVCTVSFQLENARVCERDDRENDLPSRLSLAHGEGLEFLVNDGVGNCKVTMDSDSFTLVKKLYYSNNDWGEINSYYYYILTPVEGKELPKELVITVEAPSTASQKLTLIYDDTLCDVGLYQKYLNGALSRYTYDSVDSEVPIVIMGGKELVLCVSPLGMRDVTVTKAGEGDDTPVEAKRIYMHDGSSYYYIGNVTEATRIDVTVSTASVKKEYYNVTFGSPGKEYDYCYDVFESSQGIFLDKGEYHSSGRFYQVEQGEEISFYYLTNEGYQITAAQTDDETQPVLQPVYDEAADAYIYTVVPTKDMKITPSFGNGIGETEKNYSVLFDLQGHGTEISSITVKSGDKVTEPEEPTAAGYVFGGWYKDADCTQAWDFAVDVVTARTVLYAKWTEDSNVVKYTVSFTMQGHGDAIADITVPAGEKVTAPTAPTAAGYVFGGWYQDANCTQAWDFAVDVVTANTVLYAKWTEAVAVEYTVSFDMQGHGAAIANITVSAGAKLTAPTVSEVLGYLFQGWFKEAGCVTAWDFANDVVDRDVVLYAKWMKDPNTETPEDIDDSFYETPDRKDLKVLGAAIGTIKAKTYDGSAYLPAVKVTVKDSNKTITLTEGTDYRVLYKNNINAGTGTVIVKGNGIYTGELKKEFTISKKPINKLKVVVGGMGLNDKSAPPVYVYDGGKLLQKDEAYTLSYAEDLTATKGTKKVMINATDQGNYTGSRTVNVKVYDAEKILNPENVKLDQESFDYTGKALKPAVTVTYGGAAVDKRNYSVKYQNNKDAGIGYVIVTGKKEYGGSVVKTFEIKPVRTQFALKKPAANVTYNGKLQKPKVTVVVNDGNKTKTLKAGKDYTITYSNNLHATTGAKQAVITIKGKGNYANTPTETFKFNILPQKIKKVSVKGTQGALTLTYAKRTLKEGKDYEVSYGAENKGKVEVKIEGKGDFTDSVTKKVKAAAK